MHARCHASHYGYHANCRDIQAAMEAFKHLECDLAHWQGERAAEIGSATMHPLALGDIAVSNHLTLQRDVIVMLH